MCDTNTIMSGSLQAVLTPEKINQAFLKTLKEIKVPRGELVRITEEHYKKALDFFYSSLVADEPLCGWFHIGVNDTMTEMAMGILNQNMSLMLVDPVTDEVMAIRVMGVGHVDDVVDLDKITDQPMKTMATLWEHCDHRSQFFKHYNTKSAIGFFGLGVGKQYRKQGLATFLMEIALDFIKNFQVSPIYVKTGASSAYSAKVFEKVGFELLDELKYENYIVDGQRVVGDMGDHKVFKSYGKVL